MIFFLLLWSTPGFTEEAQSMHCEIHENSEFRVRLYYAMDNLALFLIDESKTTEEHHLTFGITTFLFSFGPMYTCGLFTEINNPLGYSPQSAVYQEKTELRLKKTFEPGPKRFLNLILIPDMCSLFFQTGEDVPYFFGTKVSLTCRESLKTDLLLSLSRPLQPAPVDSWFSPKHQFPDGTLSHLSMKNRLQTHHLEISISGSLSAGDLIIPGFFIHSYIAAMLNKVTLSSVFGYCSPSYVTPGGSSTEKMVRTGGSVQWSPVAWLKGELMVYLDINHPSPVPRDHLDTSNTIDGKLTAAHTLRKKEEIDLMVREKSSLSFDENNTKEETHELTLAFGYTNPEIEIESAISLSIDETSTFETKITAGFEWCKQNHSLSLQNSLFINEATSWKGKLEYTFHKDKVDIWTSCSMKKPLPLTKEGFRLCADNPFQFIFFSIGFSVSS
ncbi:MAG: hypothetical protein JXJ04_12680 [Spirochaetales bacterium]|nr:hypothetical protein [Spirochaetales bacterium]